MGTWGTGVFENDEAQDLLDSVASSGDGASVGLVLLEALIGAMDSDNDIANDQRAVAASAVISVALGWRGSEIPNDVMAKLEELRYELSNEEVEAALRSLEAARGRDLGWSRLEEAIDWDRQLSDLVTFLRDRKELPAKVKRVRAPGKALSARKMKKRVASRFRRHSVPGDLYLYTLSSGRRVWLQHSYADHEGNPVVLVVKFDEGQPIGVIDFNSVIYSTVMFRGDLETNPQIKYVGHFPVPSQYVEAHAVREMTMKSERNPRGWFLMDSEGNKWTSAEFSQKFPDIDQTKLATSLIPMGNETLEMDVEHVLEGNPWPT